MKIYISGALTNMPAAVTLFYDDIAKVCRRHGHEPYLPHLHTPPTNPCLPEEVFMRDKNLVITSDMVIAFLGQPSFGVGMELAYAELAQIPIIAIYSAKQTISKLVLGLPNLKRMIAFEKWEDGITGLEKYFTGENK